MKQWKELNKLEMLKEIESNEIENETKIKLNLPNYKLNDILKDLEFELKHGTLKNRVFKRWNSYEYKMKSRLPAEEKVNEVERFRKTTINNNSVLLNIETKFSELLTALENPLLFNKTKT